MSKIFFYGLFMDRSLLVGKGLQPTIIGRAVLPDYRIHIAERAALLPSPSSRAYGVVMDLSDEDARVLYAEPSVRDYVPEPVRVSLLDSGEAVDADCYNLPREAVGAGANPVYAAQLARLAGALEFDPTYVAEIAAFGESPRGAAD